MVMKYSIFFIFVLLVTIGQAQTFIISIGGSKGYNIQDVQAIGIDSIGLIPDSSDYYVRAKLKLSTKTRVVALDTTINNISRDTANYLESQMVNEALVNSIANITSIFAEAQYNRFQQDSTFARLALLNPILIELTNENYFEQTHNRWGGLFVGYWKLKFYNGVYSTKYFYIDELGNIVEVQTGPNGTTIPVPGGYDGTVRIYGPRMIELRQLIPNMPSILISSPSNNNHYFVGKEIRWVSGTVPMVIEWSYAREEFQRLIFTP